MSITALLIMLPVMLTITGISGYLLYKVLRVKEVRNEIDDH